MKIFRANFPSHPGDTKRLQIVKQTTLKSFQTYLYCIYLFQLYDLSIIIRDGSRAAATSKMEHFVIIVNR